MGSWACSLRCFWGTAGHPVRPQRKLCPAACSAVEALRQSAEGMARVFNLQATTAATSTPTPSRPHTGCGPSNTHPQSQQLVHINVLWSECQSQLPRHARHNSPHHSMSPCFPAHLCPCLDGSWVPQQLWVNDQHQVAPVALLQLVSHCSTHQWTSQQLNH